MNIIELKNLTKKFNGLIAVDSINFKVKEGEVFGFLGPNGAGKTTTLSMLSTLLKPTSGEAFVNGFNIKTKRDEVRKSIGIVFQDPSLDDELTAYENLIFHGIVYDLKKEIREERISELLNLVDLEKRKHNIVKTFSGGMKRRLEIARGLMHHPKVLFLDEPTLGLDPQTRNHIWKYIEKLNKKENVTIILTTHYMEEADKLCNKIAIIDKGKIMALDSPENLKAIVGGDVVSFKNSNSDKLLNEFAREKWIKKVKVHNGTVNVHLSKVEERLPVLLKIANRVNVEVRSISIHKPTLEDAFLHFTGKTIREEEASAKDAMRLNRKLWAR
jgi:ABC-2 type transport system ATP-binding protein